MASGGHNAKPLQVLRLEGTARPDRHTNRGPTTGGEPLRKPGDLGPEASWLWDEVTQTRAAWLCSSDTAALWRLCVAFQAMRDSEQLIAVDATDKNARCAWVAYAGVFNSLAARFGLTPSDRARLGEDKEARDATSAMEELLG